jgi:uncharacterized protein
MDEQANITLVKQCYDAFMKGDIPRLMNFVDPDIDWQLPTIESIPFSGKRHGHTEVADFFETMNDMQVAQEFMPREFIVQGDRVVVLGHYAWSVRANNASYESDWTHIFTIRNGKVAAFREFLDTHVAAQAFQNMPADMARGTSMQPDMNRPSIH